MYTEEQIGFLKEFDLCDIRNSNVDFFKSTYKEPPNFENIFELIKPVSSLKKVVFIHGHPRTGKTWLAKSLITKYIEKNKSNNKVWHSGIDSYNIFKNISADIYSGIKELEVVIKSNSDKNIFLVDDFFGTNKPRSFGISLTESEKVNSYLGLEENPVIEAMPDDSTLIVTSRSLFIYLFFKAFNKNIPNRIKPSVDAKVKFIPIKWGVFQTLEKDSVSGSFDLATINEIFASVKEYNQNKDIEFSKIAASAPLIRFSTKFDNSTKLLDDKISFVLFGRDVGTLMSSIIEIRKLRDIRNEIFKESYQEYYQKLIKLYFLTISPALIASSPKIFKALKIDEDLDSLKQALYYSEEEIIATRIPNSFYFSAVSNHLDKNLAFAITIIEELNQNFNQDVLKVIFRGLAEKALSEFSDWKIHDLDVALRDSEVLKNHFTNAKENDEILNLEFHSPNKSEIRIQFPENPKPIFFSYSSWCINKLLKHDDHIVDILPKYRTVYLDHFIKRANQKDLNSIEEDKILAGFSTFLQWTLKNNQIDAAKIKEDGFRIFNLLRESDLLDRITIILEDELIWALFEKFNTSDERTSPSTLIEIEFVKDKFLKSFENIHFSKLRWNEINRYFSLIWHNEWMMPSQEPITVYYQPYINQWCDEFHGFILSKLSNVQKITNALVNNFNYHWFHFITQRSIWLRDWCLSDNPLESEKSYETTQITMGSRNPTDHQKLLDLLTYLIKNISADSEHKKSMFKTSFFFISLRTEKIEREVSLINKLEEFRYIIKSRINDNDILKSILISIFELSRHGFLQPWSKIISKNHKDLIKHIINIDYDVVSQAWADYYSELVVCLDEYDFIPQEEEGWKSIFPIDYYQNFKI